MPALCFRVHALLALLPALGCVAQTAPSIESDESGNIKLTLNAEGGRAQIQMPFGEDALDIATVKRIAYTPEHTSTHPLTCNARTSKRAFGVVQLCVLIHHLPPPTPFFNPFLTNL